MLVANIIGRILVCCLFVLQICNGISFQIDLYNLEGRPVQEVYAGVPFILHARVMDNANLNGNLNVKQINKHFFTAGSPQTSVSVINGVMKAEQSMTYQIRIDKPGVYEIGPVEFEQQGTLHKGRPVAIKVLREPPHDPTLDADQESAMIHMNINKKEAIIGEQVVLKVRIYTLSDVQQVLPHMPETPTLKVDKPLQPKRGNKRLNGKEWDYHEIEMAVYPQEAGKLTIPAAVCEYAAVKQANTNSTMGLLQQFFGPEVVQKTMRSNTIEMDIKPQPKKFKIQPPTGVCHGYSVSVNQTKAVQGDAIVVTYKLTGDFDMNQIDLKPQNLPKNLKYYHAKSNLHPTKKKHCYTKHVEYILQGIEPGNYTFPAQTFYYFDPVKEQYIAKKSAPLSLTIVPVAGGQEVGLLPENIEELEVGPFIKLENTQSRINLLWWYGLFVFFAIMCICSVLGIRCSRKLHKKHRQYIHFKMAYWLALKRLKKIAHKKNVAELPSLFTQLAAYRLRKEYSDSDCKLTDEYVRSVAADQLEEWFSFYDKLLNVSYSNKKVSAAIFEESKRWILLLKKRDTLVYD